MENAKIGNIIAGLRKNKVSVNESVVDEMLGDVNESGSTKIPKKIKMSKERIDILLGGVVKARKGITKSKKVDEPTKEILQDGINKAEKVLTTKKKKAKSVNEENLDPETVAELREIEQELTDELDRAILNNEDTTDIEQGLADVREMLADVADSASKDVDKGLPAGSSSEILEGVDVNSAIVDLLDIYTPGFKTMVKLRGEYKKNILDINSREQMHKELKAKCIGKMVDIGTVDGVSLSIKLDGDLSIYLTAKTEKTELAKISSAYEAGKLTMDESSLKCKITSSTFGPKRFSLGVKNWKSDIRSILLALVKEGYIPAGFEDIIKGVSSDTKKTATSTTDTEDYLEYNPKTKKYILTIDGDATELTKAEIQDLLKGAGVKVDLSVFVKAQKERVALGNILDDADVTNEELDADIDFKEINEGDSQDILERKYRKLINFYKGPNGKIDFGRMKKQGDYELYQDYCSRIKNDSVFEGRTFNAASISKMKQAIKEARKDKQQDPKKKSQHIENIKRHIKDLKRGDEMNNLKKSNGTWKMKDISSKASNIANKIKGTQKQIGDIR